MPLGVGSSGVPLAQPWVGLCIYTEIWEVNKEIGDSSIAKGGVQ